MAGNKEPASAGIVRSTGMAAAGLVRGRGSAIADSTGTARSTECISLKKGSYFEWQEDEANLKISISHAY
jgi:hypothetical protein